MEKIDLDNFQEKPKSEKLEFSEEKETVELKQYKEAMMSSFLEGMPKLDILCGKEGGLPFDYLMTDIFSGCLPIRSLCYANCTAAEYWIEKGFDFGKRTLNNFREESFRESLEKLPENQRWLRQGWASDCSIRKEGWPIVLTAAKILNERDISMLIITKVFNIPEDDLLRELAKLNTEIRVSISAIDSEREIKGRMEFLEKYKELDGKAIPYLMSAKYSNETLKRNQEFIIRWIQENDFIAGEHPLRINSQNPLIKNLESDGFWHPKFPNQYWFGRILDEDKRFLLPPPTCLEPEYTLNFKKFSDISGSEIEHLGENLPTYQDLFEGKDIDLKNINKHATYGNDE